MRSDHGLRPSDYAPKALRDAEAVERRRAALRASHMRPLVQFVQDLRAAQPHCYVPDLDPASGGVDARALFLFEKPGPMTDPRNGGSGFISIHNDDPTAAATHAFLERRGLPLGLCLFANAIPWWDDSRAISRSHRSLAIAHLHALVGLLAELRAIVLVGRTAQRQWARSNLAISPGMRVFQSDHPSPLVRARWPERWAQIPCSWPDRATLGQ
jgi:hypothetical protein